ncbi:ABC transporter permease [bacterium]|nr:ABC transporter permease [bacterium]NUN45087.1 ABC transporter permease [bacterium]
MLRFILKRVRTAIPMIFGLLTVTFFLIRLAPGDPTSLFIDPSIDPQAAAQLKENLGLNDPLPVQYGKWLGVIPPFEGLLQGELGISFSKQIPVVEVISEALINTLILTVAALIVDILVGVGLGVISALRRGTAFDRMTTVVGLFFYSMPHFWLALVLIMIFSLYLGWFPASQMHSIGYEVWPFWTRVQDLLAHMVLPVFVLGIASAASTIRYVRSSMLEVLQQDYIRTARAKGLPESTVIWKHGLRNALLPLITIIGLSFPFLLAGAVVTEVVFAWPGMGRVIIDAIFARDYPLIIANTMMAGVLVILGNLLADILYAVADPRARAE